ncbi:MAG: S8 family serine peptidase [Betaproteobacteria bacterium]|nr:S8 family serine peptidase [Betaproteobacteria bacterium]
MTCPAAFRLLRTLALALQLALLPPLSVAATATAPPTAEPDLATLRSALIPKREVGADQFLRLLPNADGRGVLIGIFDTGVDPAAAGMAVTTTGERKVVDIIDASGSGDVDMRTRRKPDANGRLAGLSGRALTLPGGVVNPSGDFRLGLKPASELFNGAVLRRVNDRRAAARAAAASLQAAARAASPEAAPLKAALAKAPEDRTRAERDRVARHAARTALEDGKAGTDAGALHDCVLWHDGNQWRAVIDTDEDGDLRNERVLQPFGVAGEYGSFGDIAHTTFGVQVYDGGQMLSIVTVTGDHGTHVASIAAGHNPDERGRDGIAPGARILSINIGNRRNGTTSNDLVYLRAGALLARHKADIVNVSYGGRSLLQDGRNASSRMFNALVERYGILVVMSAGNDGPALGTAGSAGAEASRVLGVGAYMSPEMGAALYSALAPSRAGAQAFSSRGPTKDGDFGVDVMAPGAAIASVSTETLHGAGLKNGTSMSSPSAAGVAALVLSAARQARLEAPAARLRAALIGGANPLPHEEPLTRGSGLVNAPGAWKKLQDLQAAPAFDAFYDLEVNRGTFTSKARGLLLREAIIQPRQRVSVRVTPVWPEAVPPARRVAFESDLRLKPSVPWITAPKTLHLTSNASTVALVVDVPPAPAGAIGSLHVGQVDALPAARPTLGPVFSIPVTLIQPAPPSVFRQHRLETSLQLKPAVTQRHFVEAPARASRLRIWVRHQAKDSLSRTFSVQAVALAAQTHVAAMEARRNAALEPGGEMSFDLALKPGTVAEVAYTLGFANLGDATLEVRLEWLGVGLGTDPVLMTANSGWAPVNLTPHADRDVKVEARLERAVHVFLPETAAVVPMDERAEWPASPTTPGPARSQMLVQRFTIDLKAPLTAHVLAPSGGDLGDAVGGGDVTLVHESGELLYDGSGSNGITGRVITLPKGKTFAVRHVAAPEAEVLKSLTHLPLHLSEAFKTPRPLPMRTSLRERFFGKPATDLQLKGGREETIYLQDTTTDELARLEPRPAHILGTLIVRDGENREIGRQALVYLPGASPSRVTNVEPKAQPVKDARSDVDKLADTLFDSRMAFVRDQRGNTQAAVATRRAELLAALRAERPQDAAVVFEQALDAAAAAGLASAVWPKVRPASTASPTADLSRTAAVLALLDEARRLAAPEAVAQQLGAPPAASADEPEARPAQEAEKKRIAGLRETLARIERLRADVHRAGASWGPAWQAVGEAKRWEPAPGDKMTRALEALMHEQAGHLGLALQAVEAQLKDDPADLKLQRQRAALYQRLGWTVDAEREQRRLALQARQRAEVDAW